jgi:hypothetical protein
VLKLTDKAITFAVSGLQTDELRKNLLVGEKLYEFVYNERERNDTFRFFKTGLSAKCVSVKTPQK